MEGDVRIPDTRTPLGPEWVARLTRIWTPSDICRRVLIGGHLSTARHRPSSTRISSALHHLLVGWGPEREQGLAVVAASPLLESSGVCFQAVKEKLGD